jgi:hypothetical protein
MVPSKYNALLKQLKLLFKKNKDTRAIEKELTTDF